MSLPSFRSPTLIRFLCCLALVLLAGPSAVRAADDAPPARDGWKSANISDDLTVWVQNGAGVSAEDFAGAYGDDLTTALDELLLFLDVKTAAQPVEIDVYSDIDAYQNAVVASGRIDLDGQIAMADPEHAVIALPIDSFSSLTSPDPENQLRHALSHVVAGWATDFQIPRGFDEGLAQYAERPNLPVQARLAALVQAASQNGKLSTWSNLNRATPMDDDDIERAQSYSMVAYLIKHQGLSDLWAFLDALKTADSWRDAMNTAFAPTTSDQLERQWKEDLPAWAAGEWRWNLMTGFDLEPARTQLERGNFEGATSALEISEQLLRDVDDPERAAEVAELKDQARIGDLAETKMAEAQQALEQFVYDRAAAAVAQAEAQYAQLPPEIRPDEQIATYKEMAARGMAATNALEIAHIQSGNWSDYADTRAAALSAGEDFAALGDTEQRDDASHLISAMDQEQLRIVLLLGALAVLTIGWLLLWLRTRSAQPMKWE
ncbi:MAG TPA: hypothetical protein VFP05_18250 [Thermomicrobiales bacterium]|nr:hypothetical protein [Thermomicrobiales bacterium]